MKACAGWRRFLFCFPLVFILPHLFSVLELHQNQAVTDAPRKTRRNLMFRIHRPPKKQPRNLIIWFLDPLPEKACPTVCNAKELLPADVLEITFEKRNDGKFTELGIRNVNSSNTNVADFDQDVGVGPDGSSKAGGKKKEKKGKKISSAVLGCNVVSNQIMMGEIQTVEY